MKKIVRVMMLGFIFVLASCGSSGSKLESVTYGMGDKGVKLSMEVKYDKDKNVQETITKNTYVYEKMGLDKEQVEEYIKNASTMYKDMSGVTEKVDYGEKEANETLTVIVKEVSKESLPVLFSINANEDGTVSLDTLTKNLESVGFKKEE